MDIDIEAVAAVAVGFDNSAATVMNVADSLRGSTFGPENAGRCYRDLGVRIAAGYANAQPALRGWGDAGKDNAVRLRSSLAAYDRVDDGTAAALDRGTGAGHR